MSPRLTPEQLPDDYATNAPACPRWVSEHWHVFPVSRDKTPLVKWKTVATSDPTMIATWQARYPNSNVGIACGPSGLLVMDADASGEFERFCEAHSQPVPRTFSVATSKGRHWYFRSTQDISNAVRLPGFELDVRAVGGYVVAPGSVHQTGVVYEPLDASAPVLDAPSWLVKALSARATSRGTEVPQRNWVKPTLASLLADPPVRGAGQANVWLTIVAGHLARTHRGNLEAFDQAVADANTRLVPPLSEAEVAKTADSIWTADRANHPNAARRDRAADESAGYLSSNGGRLHVLCGGGKDTEPYTVPWGDFDIEAQGTVVEENGRIQAFLATLHTDNSVHSVVITPELLSDDRKLRAFLAGYGASYSDPATAQPRMAPGVRVLRLLKANSPGTARVVDHLGFDQESSSFVTFSGVIRKDGHHNGWEEDIRVVANPRLLELGAKFEYGFDADEETARAVLREVLTWHHEDTMAVFASWWAASLLKPQALKRVSLFPFLALEAASGSAKTTGAFGDLIQLSGSNAGHELFTTASFRDKVSANRSGIVWNDDADDLAALEEILRGATMGVTLNKKRADNTTTAQVSLVAPIVISGEGLGLEGQKALVDRAVILNPQPVSDRRSLRNPARKQWDDIQEFHAEHGNLTRYAGWMVRLALQHSDEFVQRLTEARRNYAGRYGDNLAVITAGAWLLDEMAQTGTWAQDLAAVWCRAKDGAYLSGENSLTDDLIPWALQQFGLHEWTPGTRAPAVFSFGQEVAPGVMFSSEQQSAGTDDRTLWINTARLAHLYESYHRGSVPERTHTARALAGQISAVTGPKTEARKVSVVGGQQEFRPLLPAYSRRILARYEGDDDGSGGRAQESLYPRSTSLELDGLANDAEQ